MLWLGSIPFSIPTSHSGTSRVPFIGSGSLKALALKQKVEKMLLKEAFNAEGWRSANQLLSLEHLHHTNKVSKNVYLC